MITLEPMGGLANRMRVIASGLNLIKNSNRHVNVIWALNEDLNCEFDVLFMPIKGLSIIEKERKYVFAHHSNNPILYKKIKAYFRNKILGIDCFINEMDLLTGRVCNSFIDKLARRNKNIYIKTTQRFSCIEEEINQFQPSESIQNTIDKQVFKFNKNTIGIHIRRDDNKTSVLKSPVSLFVEKIKEELKSNIESTFYLATDDKDVEQELLDLFGTKIIVRNKVLNRNNREGIIDALIDMYCLSKTKYIYGSYWSSFSRMASLVGKIELIVLSNN
ncbi:hypothetical protein [Yeosuana sp. AK3]